jgi:hypothetical protein
MSDTGKIETFTLESPKAGTKQILATYGILHSNF